MSIFPVFVVLCVVLVAETEEPPPYFDSSNLDVFTNTDAAVVFRSKWDEYIKGIRVHHDAFLSSKLPNVITEPRLQFMAKASAMNAAAIEVMIARLESNAEEDRMAMCVDPSCMPVTYQHKSWRNSDCITNYGAMQDLFGHLVRDWGRNASEVVEATVRYMEGVRYKQHIAIAEALSAFQPSSVFVPGSGVGRLLHEIILHNYKNEKTPLRHLHAVECSNVAVAATKLLFEASLSSDDVQQQPILLVPWASNFASVTHGNTDDQYQTIELDTIPSTSLPHLHQSNIALTIVGGEFFAVTHDITNRYDAVVTLYVVDAIRGEGDNFLSVLDRIDHLLRPQGVWINVGPLAYHHGSTHPMLSHSEMVSYFVDGKGYTLLNRTELGYTEYSR
eukprot:PhF_6_TR5652/c0_g1_i1/m.8263/K19787/CARNMT1; carnosine N-methyltransferase